MVNLGKRMRSFQPLFRVRHGEGAAILPPPPAPRLAQLCLRYPLRAWNKEMQAARGFKKDHLPRLKYHNPTLPIKVEDSTALQLDLTFESNDESTLSALEKRQLPVEPDTIEYQESWSKVESKPLPAANAKAPSTPSPPQPIFMRRVTLNLAQQPSQRIWKWFQKTTNCEDFPEEPEWTALMKRLEEFAKQSEIDRQLVKAGRDAVKKQQEELKKARETAERITNEV
ncbi:uncharacterized protein Z518_08019 [Rhinocladiella mackenziei CBS 650.93]|uniref:Ribosomal protein/NADH dehydrogenase domain-containing protein n=1 Tax=Rhinocladiella mackenziei CBS 650.93 TaxID=1442369 RepID=A0A0D2IZP6_9EURO|nr:uncharacterized protein Z518_08019 [Rhinocladiella mackenziei CBS 650.93]KIX02080.1 hypothetical protein Z518_08019 [Rhinocladiella mackenziei CBS 650.93]